MLAILVLSLVTNGETPASGHAERFLRATRYVDAPALDRFLIVDGPLLQVRDAHTLEVVYERFQIGADGEVVALPTGWFEASSHALDSARAHDANGTEHSLRDAAPELLDGKRIRAALSGIVVAPPRR